MSAIKIIEAARAKSPLTIEEIAARAGCSKRSIQYWSAGKVIPSVGVLARLCDALEVPDRGRLMEASAWRWKPRPGRPMPELLVVVAILDALDTPRDRRGELLSGDRWPE